MCYLIVPSTKLSNFAKELAMAMPVYQALIAELDQHTPCILNHGNKEQEKLFLRMCHLVRRLLIIASEKLSPAQQEKIIEALRRSAESHAKVYRKDGITPYLMHALEVTNILLSYKLHDFELLVASILHDVVEDTETTLEEIAQRFGQRVKQIVYLMSKHPDFGRKQLYWSLMKEEVDLSCRWRVLVLKFADRIHNLMTLGALPIEKQKGKLQETRAEFPSLYECLKGTFARLRERGTHPGRIHASLPQKLNVRLIKERVRAEARLHEKESALERAQKQALGNVV